MAPPKKTQATSEEDLPIIYSVSLVKVRAGWVVLGITTQGQQVLESEVLTDGAVNKPEAENMLRVAVARRFLYVE